jgi:DNA-directed RNA polymerase, mitochondrial
MLAVGQLEASGVAALTTIHDCVGGLAPEMPAIAKAVRVGFVETHEANPLASYREAVLKALPDDKARAKLPTLPAVGSFDLRRVLESPYFFC